MRERRHTFPLPLGDEVPFSKGLMARALAVTGLDTERSYLIARRADRDLAERGVISLDMNRLSELAAEVIGEDEAERTVRRLRRLMFLADGRIVDEIHDPTADRVLDRIKSLGD